MIRILICIACWFSMMFASLQFQYVDLGHAFCGAWGCGPPASALLSMHLFWLSLLFPPAIFLSRIVRLNWKLIGIGLCILAGLVLTGFSVADYYGENRPYYDAGYLWQRFLLSLASRINVPVVQIALIGISLFSFGRCPCCDNSNDKDNLIEKQA